ncbi:MAG: hypothetical protein GY754_12605 [bacterium]|nr:hypothetical protein [bacterium]
MKQVINAAIVLLIFCLIIVSCGKNSNDKTELSAQDTISSEYDDEESEKNNPDYDAPEISNIKGPAQIKSNTGSFRLTATIKDNRGVASVKAYFKGIAYPGIRNAIEKNYYTFIIPVSTLNYGGNNIRIEAVDLSEGLSSIDFEVTRDFIITKTPRRNRIQPGG